MPIKRIECNDAPKAIGPYSQAVEAGDFVFVSGQLAIDPVSGNIVGEGIEEQTARVLGNIENILVSCGLSLGDIVKCEVFLTDIGDFSAMNAVYASKFTQEVKPARFVAQAAALPKKALIEIACVASRK